MRPVRSRFVATFASLLVLASAAAAQQPRAMTIVDLINVPSLSDPQLSPDGRQLLYERSDADWERNETVSHIWRADVDGSSPVQLTNGHDGESDARWSPDGTRIAFTAKRAGDEVRQIYMIANTGGEGLRLTSHPTAVSDLQWSPDGRWIYFLAEDERSDEEKARAEVNDNVFAFDEAYENAHVWRANAQTGGTERVTSGDFHVRGYTLSRDGTMLVQSRAESPLLDAGPGSEIWVSGVDGGSARQLTRNTIDEAGPQLSADNQRLLFVANSNQDFEFYYNDKLFTMPLSGGTPEVVLPDLPYEVVDATWSKDGRSIYFLANTGVRQDLFRVDPATDQVTQLTQGDHTVGGWSYDPELDRHVFTVSSPTNGGDVYALDAAGGEPRQLTNVFAYLSRDFRLPRTEAVQWKGEDGEEVEGLLFYPLDYREGTRYPLVVQTHGGPAASDKFSWHSSSNYVPVLTAMGYMVFKPNYRGSTGYGDAFLRDMVGHYFNQAHKDVMAGVDHLIAEGVADGDRMAKMGWSAGGHMTNKIITYTDRFKAASSGAGAVDWVSMYAQSDTRVYRTPWFGGDPWQENAPIDQYMADSPLYDLDKVTTPTIVLVGEDDARVPMPQSVELYRGLKANGVPTHLYVAPGQGHGWRELQQRLFKANVELDWFERWVRDRQYTWETSPVHPKTTAVSEDAARR